MGSVEAGDKQVMVFAQTEGRVLWVDAHDSILIEALKTAKEKNLLVNVNFRDFTGDNQNCPLVTRYSDYRNNQFTQDCYLIKTSMYYRSPSDIERKEREGRHLTGWDLGGVADARKQAFKNWRDYNP